MTSRLLKRRQITRLSISIATSANCLGLLALALGLFCGIDRAEADKALRWGSTGAESTTTFSRDSSSSSATMFRDPQVIAAAWDEADAAVAVDQGFDPFYVAQRRSVVVRRSANSEAGSAEDSDNSLSEERFAKLPEDPFDNEAIEQYESSNGSEDAELFGIRNDETASEELVPPSVETPAPEESQYDLFNEPLDLFEAPKDTEKHVAPTEANNLEVEMPDDDEESSDRETTDTDAVDLWMTSQEITPTEEGEDASRFGSSQSDVFEKLTRGDTEAGNLEGRFRYQADEIERELIDDDPNDWLDYNLLQPELEELTEEHRRILEEERTEHQESCKDEIEKLRAQKVENIDLSIRLEGNAGQDFPFECSLEDKLPEPRHWPQITYMWKASGLCHKPLYFEQVQLERYGHSWGPIAQPLLSGVHFFGTIPILPYKMGLQTPNECVYPLGYYRPGDCAPYMIEAIPFTWRAAGYQAGFVTGLNFIIP